MGLLLILDEQSVAAASGVTFHLSAAVKHPANPVLLPGEPHHWDSLQVSWPGTVLYSPRDRTFRCWYSGLDVIQAPDRAWRTGYAESDDGIHWRKPDLGQVAFLGQPTNQVRPSWAPSFLSTVFENPLPDAPDGRRFGGYWTEHRFAGAPNDWQTSLWAKSCAWSPDGITWTRAGRAYGERPRAPFLDISQLLYDPADPDPAWRWKAYGQLFRPRPDGRGPPGIRHIAVAHGTDVGRIEDTAHRVVLAPAPGIDEEVHFAAVQKTGERYLMLFESDRFSRNPIDGDLRLAVSSDGRTFRRVHPQTALVGTGPRGTWDENLLVTNTAGWQQVGDEVWIHYFGCPNTYNSWPAQYAVVPERRGSQFAPVYLGLAMLPRDRYGYAAGPGTIRTGPLDLGPGGLWVNAEGEAMTVAAVDAGGRCTANGQVGGERRLTVYRRVIWDRDLRGEHQIQLTLPPGAKLYSLAH